MTERAPDAAPDPMDTATHEMGVLDEGTPTGRLEPLLIGTTVCGGAIAAGAGHIDDLGQLVIAIVGTVLVYWVAHLHAATLAHRVEERMSLRAAFGHALESNWLMLAAALIPVVILVICDLLGVAILTASWIALGATVALLGGYGYVAAGRGGLSPSGRVVSAIGGVLVGLLIMLLKASLH
jgi:hypothetical protein